MNATRTRIALPAAGLLLLGAYLVATARIPMWRYFGARGITVDFVYMLGPDWERATVEYVALVALTFGAYLGAVAIVWRAWQQPPWWLVMGFAALFALALVPMYPPTAVDMFHYHAMARIAWVFGANPLITPQGDFPYPIGMSWSELPSPYGPLWSLLTGPAAVIPRLFADDVTIGLYAFKAMGALSVLATAGMIWRIVGRMAPGQQALATLLFAWNPFVLLRIVGNGHNELWMMLPVLIALECVQRRWWVLAIEALTLSVLVKFATALLGPPLLLYIWMHADGDARTRLRLIARAGAVAAITAALAYAPFFEGRATFAMLSVQSTLMITSTPLLLELFLQQIAYLGWNDPARAADDARWITRLAFLLVYPTLVWHARRDFRHLVTLSFTILFLYLLVASSWYRPWYMVWPVTLAALRPRSWLTPVLLAATLGGAFPDLIEQFRGHWPWLAEYTRAIAAPVVVAFVPPLLFWLYGLARTGEWGLESSAERESAAHR